MNIFKTTSTGSHTVLATTTNPNQLILKILPLQHLI